MAKQRDADERSIRSDGGSIYEDAADHFERAIGEISGGGSSKHATDNVNARPQLGAAEDDSRPIVDYGEKKYGGKDTPYYLRRGYLGSKTEFERNEDTGKTVLERKRFYGEKRIFTEEDADGNDRAAGKERKIFGVTKRIDRDALGNKALQRGFRGLALSYSFDANGRRSFNGIKVGSFELLRLKGENGSSFSKIQFGNTFLRETRVDERGFKSQSTKLPRRDYSYSVLKDEKGNVCRKVTQRGNAIKGFEKLGDGSEVEYAGKGKMLPAMSAGSMAEAIDAHARGDKQSSVKIRRLQIKDSDGEVTRDYKKYRRAPGFSHDERRGAPGGYNELTKTKFGLEKVQITPVQKVGPEENRKTPGAWPDDPQTAKPSLKTGGLMQKLEARESRLADRSRVRSASVSR